MASSNGQRVAAFTLALLFLLTTVGFTAFVIWEINGSEGGLINEDTTASQQLDPTDPDAPVQCGVRSFAAEEPREVPEVVSLDTAVTELTTVDVVEGEGAEVQPGDCVAALYYGTLASNGERFDGSYSSGQPIEFSLNQVIQGWTDGIPGMKVGGVRRIEIPAAQAYGEAGSGETIPPNSDLIFEVEIVSTRSI